MVAALYVDADGVYSGRPDVDPWPESRDARRYAGPWPVVAHPPCQRWGKLWRMGGRWGEDDGCFAAALASVEQYGGVIEHPEASTAWPTFGLPIPNPVGGWTRRAGRRGWSCAVEQGHYGHRARKATWLYWYPADPSRSSAPFGLTWGPAAQRGVWVAHSSRLPAGFEVCTDRERRATPPAFADLLVELARESRRSPFVCDHFPAGWTDVVDDGGRTLFASRGRCPRSGTCTPTPTEPSRSLGTVAERSPCAWCSAPFPPGARSHARTCSKRCRQAIQRWRQQGRPDPTR